MADLKTKILTEGGTNFVPLFGSQSTFKCFKEKATGKYKLIIDLTFDPKDVNLKQVGEILGDDGKPLTEDQIKAQKGWIFFPKYDATPTEVQDGQGFFIYNGDEKATLNLTIQLTDSGKTQSGT